MDRGGIEEFCVTLLERYGLPAQANRTDELSCKHFPKRFSSFFVPFILGGVARSTGQIFRQTSYCCGSGEEQEEAKQYNHDNLLAHWFRFIALDEISRIMLQ